MSRSFDVAGGAPVELKTPQLLLTPKQAAEALALSERKLWSLTAGGDVPCVRIGKCVRYSVEALREWIEEKSTC